MVVLGHTPSQPHYEPQSSKRTKATSDAKKKEVQTTCIDRLENKIGLEPYLERKPTEFSGGQQRRVAIARAMIKTPDVLLFDEPLSNLDAKLRATMREEIACLHKKLRTTTVYVTHDQMEAMTLADRIVLMKDGQIEQVGSPVKIYERPVSLFVADFIGTPAMNSKDITIHKSGDQRSLKDSGTELKFDKDRFDLEVGQEVTLGIRPSDLIAGEAAGQPTSRHERLGGVPRR